MSLEGPEETRGWRVCVPPQYHFFTRRGVEVGMTYLGEFLVVSPHLTLVLTLI